MSCKPWLNLLRTLLVLCAVCASVVVPRAQAASTDISPIPLGTRSGDNIAPNLMFVLDDSGSMARNYLPDQMDTSICKSCDSSTCNRTGVSCVNPEGTGGNYVDDLRLRNSGLPPFNAPQFNTIFYNPAIAYLPGVNYLNVTLGNQPTNAAKHNPYSASAAALNVAAGVRDVYWCTSSFASLPGSPTAAQIAAYQAQFTNPAVCQRNGIDNGTFDYWGAGTATATGTALPTTTFRVRVIVDSSNPYYYNITPKEYCTDETLINCTLSTTATGAFVVPAYVRWCRNASSMNATAVVTGGSPRECQALVSGTYQYPRFGSFTRVDIKSSTATYPKASTRTDCAGTVGPTGCSYAEELQNYANWYSYYSSRVLMMKTVPGRVFASLGNDPNSGALRAGFLTINASNSDRYLQINDFKNNTHRQNWFTKLYDATPGGATPLRQALSRVGRHYAGVTTGINSFMPDEPLLASCQRNYTLLTTDGYWNGNAGQNLTGGGIGNQDNVANTSVPLYVDRATTGTLDAINATFSQVTPTTQTEEQAVVGTANSTFAAVSGVTSGANQAGTCPAGQARIKRRTTTFNSTVPLVNGTPSGTPTVSGVTYTFSDVGSCADVTTTVVQGIRERTTQVFPEGGTTNFAASTFNTNISPNPQFNYNCTGAGVRTIGIRRDMFYNRTTVTVGTGTPTVTFSNLTSASVFSVTDNCSTSGKSGSAPALSNVGSATTTVTGLPTPAGSSSVNGTATVTPTSPGGSGDTLADVAMYYYKNDLRTSGAFARNNVPVSGKYIAPHQHMVTFTMGLGLDGLMTYRDDYETTNAGDFFKIKTGATNCLWTTGTCNWPIPVEDTPTAIDDLWHAAVNGRGKYFSARAPIAAENGIKDTFAAINIATGSAAAAATSTPNLTTTNNSLYSSTYRTVKWDGEIRALSLDPTTGVLNSTPTWTAADQLNARGLASSDTRSIYTFDAAAATRLKSFTYANLTASEQAYFSGKCTIANWSQCSYIASDTTRLGNANNGANLVNYLRGQRGNELSSDTATGLYRAREFLLGDTVNAKPAFMGPPEQQYNDAVSPDYGTFKTANATRQKVLFVAANDGMVHAFNADTGAELWAYIPKMVMPNLYRLANASYGTNHAFFVDGSPTLADVFVGGAWKTVLVGGLNSGGRGFYALDVTDPAAPKALWEICSDAALCGITDNDMGLTYGQPVIAKRPSDGQWVVYVTSGYNNIGPGDGGGHLYMLDLATGAVLEKVATGAGDMTTPSGFAKISGFATNSLIDNTVTLVYGGDLLGNVWRFDVTTSPPTVQRIAQLKDGSTPPRPQSVTTRPEITRFNAGFNVIYVGTGRFIGESDLADPATLTPPLPFAYQQSIYAFKDKITEDLGNLRLPAANLVKQTISVVDAATRAVTSNAVNWSTNNGWYVDLNPGGDSPGERVNIDIQLVRGTLVAIANEPNAETCSAGGDSFLYQFDYNTGSAIPGTEGGVVGTKIGNTLAVGIVVFQTLTGQMKSVITTSDGKLPQKPIDTAGSGLAPQRAAWRELFDTRTDPTDPNEVP
jgi:type IV pilus assembly protein PilY1